MKPFLLSWEYGVQTTKYSLPASWSGVPKVWVSVSSERPYWFLNHSKHLHCLCQANTVISSIKDWEIEPQEDVTQDPGLCRWTHFVFSKGGIAVASRILRESDTLTSQHEPLPVTPPSIQTQHNSLFYFPLLVSIKGFSLQQVMWELFQNQRGPRHEVAMRKRVVSSTVSVWSSKV